MVWTADSNGKASAARRPVLGAEKVTPGLKVKMREYLSQGGARDVMTDTSSTSVRRTGNRFG